MPPRIRLVFATLSLVVFLMAAVALYGELSLRRDIWWTPYAMLVPLAQSTDRVEIYARGKPLAALLQAGRLQLAEDGGASPLAPSDVGLRFDNWDGVRAERLLPMLAYAVGCGITACLFLLVLTGRLAYRDRVALSVLAVSLSVAPGPAAADSNDAWAALVKGGHVVLIRHGNAPPGYGGDPPGFKIDDCKTQRNLDEQGRGEARALGEAFRNHGVRVDRILSSPWCRCLETARLMAVGPVETSWALVPDTKPNVSVRRDELKAIVAAWRGPGTLVLVTHGLTVRALLGFLPIQGETVVLKPGSGSAAGGDLVGLIAAPQ